MNRQPSPPKYIKKEDSDVSLLKWSAILMAAIFFLVYTFKAGLFNGYDFNFEKKLIGASIYSLVFVLLMCVHLFKVWNTNSWKAILSIAVWLLPLSFAISSIGAASDNTANIMTMVSCLLAAFFVFGLYYNDNRYTRVALESILILTSYVLVWFGILNLFGQYWYPDALWFQLETYRMTSVFQYPNTYAALLIAILLAAAYYTTHAKKRIWIGIHAFMLVPVFVSFMLTYSRAALVVIPLAVLLTMPFLKVSKQLMYVFHLFITVAISFAVLGTIESKAFSIAQKVLRFNDNGSQIPPEKLMPLFSSEALTGWGVLIGASVVSLLLILALHRWIEPWLETKLERFSKRKISYLAAPVSMIVLTVLGAVLILSSSAVRDLLPTNLSDRLENISFKQHSVLERGTFYENGLKIVADYPLFGTGGGGWQALYQKYQTNPYTSNQTHSYLMQVLVETGWIGLLLHLGFFVLAYWLFVRSWIRHPEKRGNQLIYFIFTVSILLHSLFDFDMSYISIAAIVFFCLGSMVGFYDKELELPKFTLKNQKLKHIYPAVLSLVIIVTGIFAYRFYASYIQFDKARTMAQQQATIDQIFPVLDKAISLSPSNTQYYLVKADWLTQVYKQTQNGDYLAQSNAVLQKAASHDPYDRQLIQEKYKNQLLGNNIPEAIKIVNDGLTKFPWDIRFYEMGIKQYADLGLQEKNSQTGTFQDQWNQAALLYKEILDRKEKLKLLPKEQLQGRPFDITTTGRQALAQIDYYSGRYAEAVEMLKPTLGDALVPQNEMEEVVAAAATSRSAIRYYLASLEKLGQNDPALKEKLVQADPNEEALLKELTAK
ncbi:O-antigen ligase family protein [Paenibacillus pasadenensis]|uniref:O-antigen ligase family protein n=1 Tax=Paenibacillus pasadenensis TaxID=217090 RepID=UPI00203B8287|nr:O-antigen ligase family protein [Paenibacillus pasadenensis]MCM3747654.1 O-antigen ligase family protein [Paenibacillus pasadenensis]